jgi:hypothetical protein
LGKNSKKNNGNNFANQAKIFIYWGLYGGLLIPFASMLIILMCPNLTDPVVESKKNWVIAMIFGYVLAMFAIGFHILALNGNEDAQRGKRHSIAGSLLIGLGFFSLFVLYFLVLWTGGLSISPFSGYFIYTPVVVFLAFRKFKKVLIAGIVAIILAVLSTTTIINLVSRSDPSTFKSVTPWIVTAEYQLHYLIVVITQVIASMQVARISGRDLPSR